MGYFLMLVAVTIAGVAAYFSVYGLAHIFAATFWSVVIMGGVLEVGKLVATSFLYRYWDSLRFLLRTYLLVAIAGLMLITSAGIFGYLSNAYQQDIVGVKDVAARIELLDQELATLSERERQINEDIGRIGSNYVTARQNLMKQYAPEKDAIIQRVASIRSERLELSTKQLEVEAHTGPIIYIAKAFDKTVDDAVLWMILLIIFVFDPLAVALTIGANIALMSKANKPDEERIKEAPRAYLEPDVLEKAAANGDARLESQMEKLRNQEDVESAILKTTLPTAEYDSLCARLEAALLENREMEEDLHKNTALVDQLTDDNNRLEDAVDRLVQGLHKKDLTIEQLREALSELERQRSMSIEERVELHNRNQILSKQNQ